MFLNIIEDDDGHGDHDDHDDEDGDDDDDSTNDIEININSNNNNITLSQLMSINTSNFWEAMKKTAYELLVMDIKDLLLTYLYCFALRVLC